MRFPAYDYDDMVASQHAMLIDGLHVDHLRLILGTSMGCMQTFVWGETYPDFSDALAPFACLPVAARRAQPDDALHGHRRDQARSGVEGRRTTRPSRRRACAPPTSCLFVMGSAPLQMQKLFPTRAAAEQRVDSAIAASTARTDANDLIYYVDASRNYDPSREARRRSPRRCCGSTRPTTSSTRRSWASPRGW